MWLYRRENSPYWWAKWEDPPGSGCYERRSTRCRDKAAARKVGHAWELAAEQAAADAAAGIERPRVVTLIDLASEYLAALELERSASYAARQLLQWQVRILPFFGEETPAHQVNRGMVEAFRRSLLDGSCPTRGAAASPVSTATANRYTVALRRCFEFGVRSGWLRENPARSVRPLRERPEKRHRALTRDELRLLFAELERRRQGAETVRWARFIVGTGLRDRETRALLDVDVDLVSRRVHVRAANAKDAERRDLPMTAAVVAVIRAQLEARPADELVGAPRPVWGDHDRRAILAAAWKATGLPGRAPTAHDFRHTFASRCIRAGVDLETLRKLLGHSSLLTTQRYVHAYGDHLERVADVLDRLDPGDD